MKKYKMLVTDFDGTFLRSDGTISKETLNEIKKFQDSGGIFAICTGRVFSSISIYCKELGLGGIVVTSQGAVIGDLDSGEILNEENIDNETAIKMVTELENRGLYTHIYYDDKVFTAKRTADTVDYEKACRNHIIDVNEKLSNRLKRLKIPINKILSITSEEGVLSLIDEYNKSAFSEKLAFNLSDPRFFEIVSVNATKERGVKFLSKHFSVPLEDIIAVGDSYNDIPMIKTAGLGIAVGNAFEKVKEVADLVTVKNDEDAILKILKDFCN